MLRGTAALLVDMVLWTLGLSLLVIVAIFGSRPVCGKGAWFDSLCLWVPRWFRSHEFVLVGRPFGSTNPPQASCLLHVSRSNVEDTPTYLSSAASVRIMIRVACSSDASCWKPEGPYLGFSL